MSVNCLKTVNTCGINLEKIRKQQNGLVGTTCFRDLRFSQIARFQLVLKKGKKILEKSQNLFV